MKEKKKITLGTVIATSIGSIIWIVVTFYHRQLLANTTALDDSVCGCLEYGGNHSYSPVSQAKKTRRVKQIPICRKEASMQQKDIYDLMNLFFADGFTIENLCEITDVSSELIERCINRDNITHEEALTLGKVVTF